MQMAILILLVACNSTNDLNNNDMKTKDKEKYTYTNSLIDESSPYLLQHAHNPVNWYSWGEEALNKAKAENKPLLISIGYSSCHWCHVMEHESFEDIEVANLMNENFICIKVDKEERPDIDNLYMTAVQLIAGNGGWPLNCFALPDGRPFYGGTYFRKNDWIKLLTNISNQYTSSYNKIEASAERLEEGIVNSETQNMNASEEVVTSEQIENAIKKLSKDFDDTYGGTGTAPKFPTPNNYTYLLKYSKLYNDKVVSDFVELTLDNIAYGGIYDQIGGGFARYSTDKYWKVPHFEKMLYDNAQLVSLYSEAYKQTNKQLYKDVVYQTLQFVEEELTSPEGAFYSALDADSEGKEGKYYIWTSEELKSILGKDFEIVKEYYNVDGKGYWEEDNNILLRSGNDEKIAKKFKISTEELKNIIDNAKVKLKTERDKRVKPGLDDKSLTSWNGLMTKAYVDAYKAFGEDKFLEIALKNARHIQLRLKREDGGLYHSYKDGKSYINGYLDDYSFYLESCISLYEVTGNGFWIDEAVRVTEYAFQKFYNEPSGLFNYTSSDDKMLIVRSKEIIDNVVPSSNSSMALSLYKLSLYTDNNKYLDASDKMLARVSERAASYPSYFSNWGVLMLDKTNRVYEIVVVGENAEDIVKEINKKYLPNTLVTYTVNKNDDISLFKNRYVDDKTLIYICENKACKTPVETVVDALKLIN